MADEKRKISFVVLAVLLLIMLGVGVYLFLNVSKLEDRGQKDGDVELTESAEKDAERMEIVRREDPNSKELPIIERPPLNPRGDIYKSLQIGLVEVTSVSRKTFDSIGGGSVDGLVVDVKYDFNGEERILKVPMVGTIEFKYGGGEYTFIDVNDVVVSEGDRISVHFEYVNTLNEPSEDDVRVMCDAVSNSVCLYYMDNFGYGTKPIDFYEYFYGLMESKTAELSFEYVAPSRMQNMGSR